MAKRRRKKGIGGAAIGSALAGFDQAVLKSTPPPQEMVIHARHHDAIATADGRLITIRLPGDPEITSR